MPQSTEEYVTVLSVESVVESDNCSADDDDDDSSNFVTVLRVGEQLETVNEADDENGQVVNEVVKIYRLPGERLGMGLKFVGGVSVDETIERLFIQSIAADSPADRTKGINGKLREGDEILKIDGRDVDSMTRLECVAVLREATVCISVTVSHVNESSLKRKPNGPPPPVPPRKTSKLSKQVDLNERLREERSKLKPPPPVPQIREANNGGEEDRGEVAEVDGKVEDDNRLVPPEPSAVYTDIISEENVFVFDSESDDTGSSVSTVISRAPSSCASTTDSTLADVSSLSNGEMLPASLRYGDQMIQDYDSLQNHPFDLDLVLSPFEELERELALDDNGHPTFVFDEEGAVADEDLFKCLDEAIDAVDDDDEITIEPPECFQDDSGIAVAKIESEIVRNVGGGELTCFRNTRELSRELCDESTDATRDSEDVKNESLILEDLRTPEKLKNQCMKAIKIVACRDGAISDELERTERAQSDGPCQTIDDDSAKCDTTEEDDGITEDVPEDVSEKPPPVPPPRRKSLSRDNKKSKNDDDDGDGSPTDPDQERIGDVPAEYDPGISTGDLDAECRKLDQRTLESGPSDDVAGSDLIAEDVCNNREKHADSEEYDDDDDDDQILLILRDSNHPNYCSNDEDDVKNTDGMMIQSRMMSIEDTVTASYDDDEEKRCDADFQDYSAENTSQDSNRNDDSTTNASLETQTSNHHDDTHAYRTDSSHKLRDCDDVISFDAHHLKMNGSVGSTFNGCDCFESSTLVYHNRQPPDGHEFPPRYYDTCDNQFNFEKMKEFKCNLQHHCNSSNPVRPPAVSIAYMTECIDPKEYRQSSRQSLAKSEPPPPLPTVPPPPPQTDSPNEDKSFPAIVGCLTKGQTVKPPGNVENFNLSSDFSKSSPFYRSMTHESESSRQPRWKSEENLRNTIPRNPDNKPVSVKERIAMFSAHSDTSGTQTLPPRAKKSPARVEERICKVEANNEVSSTVGRGLDWTDGTSYTLPSFDAERPLLSKMDKSKSVENLDSVQMRSTSFDGTISPGIINKRNDSNDRKKFAVSEDHPVQMKRRESFSGYISSYPESQLAGYRYSNYPTTSNGLRTGCLPQTPTSAAVMNLLESRRLGASKLRGLVIPDKSSYSNQPKNLSTVFKNEFSGRPKVDNLSQSAGDPNFCKQTMNGDMMGSSAVNLMEPPWKLGNANANTLSTIPKYSPAFKRRSLQLAPSITSNSGIYSTTPAAATSKFTNESCASSSLAKNTCQFSMATSKPVEPLLPELPSAVPSSELNTDVFQKKKVFNRETLKSGMKNDDHRRASQDSTLATNCMLNGFDNRTPKKFDKGVKKQSVEVKALSRLNNLIVDEKNGDPKLTNGVKEAVNGFISEALLLNGHQNKRNTFSAQDIKSPFSSTKFSSELGNDSCFEDDEEDLTSKSISPAPSTPSDDMQSDVSFLRCDDSGISYRDNTMRSRYARRTNSSDSALKSVSSDQKSYSATDDSWSDASSDSAERPLDPEFKPRKISQQRTVLKERENETDSVRNFRALAQTWQQRARKDDAKRSPSFDINKCDKNESSIPKYKYNVINTYSKTQIDSEIYPSTYIDLGRCKDQIMQKNSVNSKSWLMNNSKSLDGLDKIDQNNRKNIRVSNNARNAANIANNNSKIGYEKTINDSIKSNYLESAINDGSCNGGPTNIPTAPILHKRLSSIGSSISEGDYDSSPGEFNCTSPVTSPSEVYGSVSSLASNTSYSSIQEIQQLMEEAYHSLEESGRTDHQILIIVLHKEEFKFSTGLTVSGGSDYEQKEIIIHRIIKGGLAAKDGRLRKGDRILSINGRTLKNVTHRETLTMLKSPRSEITLVISRPKDQDSTEIDAQEYKLKSCPSIDALTEHLVTTRDEFEDKSQMSNVEIIKEGSGLGFSLEGGKDSPDGDHPLRIKKIFTGGAAEKCKSLRLGDEIVSVNNHNLNSMSRLEAWQFIKRLPEGRISLTVKHT